MYVRGAPVDLLRRYLYTYIVCLLSIGLFGVRPLARHAQLIHALHYRSLYIGCQGRTTDGRAREKCTVTKRPDDEQRATAREFFFFFTRANGDDARRHDGDRVFGLVDRTSYVLEYLLLTNLFLN